MTNTEERPVLLLDIDGVLNLFPQRLSMGAHLKGTLTNAPSHTLRDHTAHRVRLDDDQEHPYMIRIPTDVASLVSQLQEHFDVHWYTMWNVSADAVFAPMAGLPSMPYLLCDWTLGQEILTESGAPVWLRREVWRAKTPLIETHIGQRPFCWIDDDTTAADDLYLETYATVGPFRIITVASHNGLTQAVVDEAIEWAQSLTIKEEVAS